MQMPICLTRHCTCVIHIYTYDKNTCTIQVIIILFLTEALCTVACHIEIHTSLGRSSRAFLQQLGILHFTHLPSNLHEEYSQLSY